MLYRQCIVSFVSKSLLEEKIRNWTFTILCRLLPHALHSWSGHNRVGWGSHQRPEYLKVLTFFNSQMATSNTWWNWWLLENDCFLQCSTSNLASTVLNCFRLPSRVRSDKGGENVARYLIICWVIRYRDLIEGAILLGEAYITKEQNLFGETFFVDVFMYTTTFSMQWNVVCIKWASFIYSSLCVCSKN